MNSDVIGENRYLGLSIEKGENLTAGRFEINFPFVFIREKFYRFHCDQLIQESNEVTIHGKPGGKGYQCGIISLVQHFITYVPGIGKIENTEVHITGGVAKLFNCILQQDLEGMVQVW